MEKNKIEIKYMQCDMCGKWADCPVGYDLCKKCLEESWAEVMHEEMMWHD